MSKRINTLFPVGSRWSVRRVAPTLSGNMVPPYKVGVIRNKKDEVDMVREGDDPQDRQHVQYSTLATHSIPLLHSPDKRVVVTLTYDLTKVVCIYERIDHITEDFK